MTPCTKCGSRRFSVEAIYTAKDVIELSEDTEDFEIVDTTFGDGEWEDWATVTCDECHATFEYQQWKDRTEAKEAV